MLKPRIKCLLFLIFIFPSYAFSQNFEVWQGAATSGAFADGSIRQAFCDISSHMQGSYGALLFAAAGIVGLLSLAIGNSKTIIGALVVGASCVALPTGISFYFGDLCGNQAQTAPANTGNTAPLKTFNDNSIEEPDQTDPFQGY